MTREQLVAMSEQATQKLAEVRDQSLRLEGYRMCLNDIIKADTEAAAAASSETASTTGEQDEPAA